MRRGSPAPTAELGREESIFARACMFTIPGHFLKEAQYAAFQPSRVQACGAGPSHRRRCIAQQAAAFFRVGLHHRHAGEPLPMGTEPPMRPLGSVPTDRQYFRKFLKEIQGLKESLWAFNDPRWAAVNQRHGTHR